MVNMLKDGMSCTDITAPTYPPQLVHGEAVDSTTIKVTWNPPPAEHQNGAIAGYRVFYTEAAGNQGIDDASVVLASVPSSETTYAVRGLRKWTLYNVWVLAYTLKGDGPHSDVIVVQTAEDGELFYIIIIF